MNILLNIVKIVIKICFSCDEHEGHNLISLENINKIINYY